MASQPLQTNATGNATAPLPPARILLARVLRKYLPRLGLWIMWGAALIFFIHGFLHFNSLMKVQSQLAAEQQELRAEQQRLADWRQKAAFAETPDFLDSAVKELTLTRDADEIEIQVEPSPVPPVGDVR